MTTLVWAVVYGTEVYTLLSGFDIPAWSAPVKNLSMLTAFPLNCSITGALVLLYVFRWLMLFCGAVIVLLISSRMKRMEVAYIAASAVTLLPSLLYAYMGIGGVPPAVDYPACGGHAPADGCKRSSFRLFPVVCGAYGNCDNYYCLAFCIDKRQETKEVLNMNLIDEYRTVIAKITVPPVRLEEIIEIILARSEDKSG